MMIRRLAVVMAAFVVQVLVPVPALASPAPEDVWSCGPPNGSCWGAGVEAVGFFNVDAALAADLPSWAFRVEAVPSFPGFPGPAPDPTHWSKFGLVFGCRNDAGLLTQQHRWFPAVSWAELSLLGWSSTVNLDCAGLGKLKYLGLLERNWYPLWQDEPTSYDVRKWWGVGCEGGYQGMSRSCLVGSGSGGSGSYLVVKDAYLRDPIIPSGGPWWYVEVEWWNRPCQVVTPVSRTGAISLDGARPWLSVGENQMLDHVAVNAHNVNPVSEAWFVEEAYYKRKFGWVQAEVDQLNPKTGPNGHTFRGWCPRGAETPKSDGGTCADIDPWLSGHPECWEEVASVTVEGVVVPPPPGTAQCLMVVTDPSTWGDAARCEIVLQLRQANEYLAVIAAQAGNMGRGSGGEPDASSCDGVIKIAVCLLDEIGEAIAGLAELLTTLFAPSEASYERLGTLQADFVSVPPGSLLSASSTAVEHFASGLANGGCASPPAIDFGASGIDGLTDVVVAWPSMCGGGAAFGAGSALFQAAYNLMALFIYGLLAFALWRMARSAFGGRD